MRINPIFGDGTMQEFNKTWSTEIIKGIFHASEGHDKNFFLREMVYHLYRLKNKKTYFEIERRKNLSILYFLQHLLLTSHSRSLIYCLFFF